VVSQEVQNKIDKVALLKLLLEKKRRLCLGSYYEFFKYFWDTVIIGDDFVDNWHIKLICDELQTIGEQVIKREPKLYDLDINVPPGESKTTMVTVLWNAWLWAKDPTITLITNSHSGPLATKHAVLTKDCIKSEKYSDMFGYMYGIRRDIDSKTFYKNTEGGSRIVTSTKAGITGEHAHIIINDDSLAASVGVSKAALKSNKAKQKELSTRKKDKHVTVRVNVGQRLHEEDTTAINIKQSKKKGTKLKRICIPATNAYPIIPARLKVFYQKGYMNLKRSGPEEQADALIELGPMGYAAQHGQQPQKLGGNLLKRENITVISPTQVPLGYNTAKKFTTMDTAQTKDELNDPTGIGAFRRLGNKIYIYDYMEYRETYEGAKLNAMDFLHLTGTRKSPCVIENKSNGRDIQTGLITHHAINAVLFNPGTKDKVARFMDIIPYFCSGRFVIVKGSWDWEGFIKKLLMFPNLTHDEPIDVSVMAVNKGLKNQHKHTGTRKTTGSN